MATNIFSLLLLSPLFDTYNNNVIQCLLVALGIILFNSCKCAMEVRIIRIISTLQMEKIDPDWYKASKVQCKHQRAKSVKGRNFLIFLPAQTS